MVPDCSIIIPVYNSEKTIHNLFNILDNLKNLKYKYEIIVINDGSKDNTVRAVEKYRGKYNNIRLINKDNGGVSSARNVGIKEAKGQYIYFADADDEIYVNTLDKMISLMILNQTDLILANYEVLCLDNGSLKVEECGIPYEKILSESYIRNEIFYRFIVGKSIGLSNLWNKVFVKKIIENNSIRFDEERTHGEDWAFVIDYLEVCEKIQAMNSIVYTYKLDGSQTYEKYKKNLGYSLVDGCEKINRLKNKYCISITEKENLEMKNRYAQQFISYLKITKCKKNEISQLGHECVKEIWKYMMHLSMKQLRDLDYSGRNKLAFILFYLRIYKLGIRLI